MATLSGVCSYTLTSLVIQALYNIILKSRQPHRVLSTGRRPPQVIQQALARPQLEEAASAVGSLHVLPSRRARAMNTEGMRAHCLPRRKLAVAAGALKRL